MDVKNEIIKIAGKNLKLPHYKIFLFGSRVSGKADERSDIDIGIEAGREVPLDVISEIKTELEDLPVIQKFDLVDFRTVSKGFKKAAMKNSELIYEQ